MSAAWSCRQRCSSGALVRMDSGRCRPCTIQPGLVMHIHRKYSKAKPRSGIVASVARHCPISMDEATMPNGIVDYYSLLQISHGAAEDEIKVAYRQLQKQCHPDVIGSDDGHRLSALLNEAYVVLSNERAREMYDVDLQESKLERDIGFENVALSQWMPEVDPGQARNWRSGEDRALFVDERACIGCKNCIWQAQNTFIMDEVHGRARVVKQWANTEDEQQAAADSCPVECIHWVSRKDLPVLEHVMKSMGRVSVATMKSYNHTQPDVFYAAEIFRRKKRDSQAARNSWMEAYMYTQAQEAAMREARGERTFQDIMDLLICKVQELLCIKPSDANLNMGVVCSKQPQSSSHVKERERA